MNQDKQPEALRLADALEKEYGSELLDDAANELRRQHARVQELESHEKLLASAIGSCLIASGIVRSNIDGFSGPQLLLFADDLKEQLEAALLTKHARIEELEAAQQAAVQQGVQQIKANCYSDDDGDSWCDNPYECDFPKGLKVGETFELQASIRSWSETFRVTKAPDETSDDYEVELVSSDAPTFAAPQAQDVQDAGEVISDLASALDMFVGSDPVHSLCEHECMDVMGRVKGTWSKAAEVNARAALSIHRAAIAASAKGGV